MDESSDKWLSDNMLSDNRLFYYKKKFLLKFKKTILHCSN